MKTVILAGGYGTRLSEETGLRPKPMVEIGGLPILWHIMKIYSTQGFNEFIICLGYKGYVIKEYFANYFLHTADVTFDVQNNSMEVHTSTTEPWKVTLVETGEGTNTGGRIKRISPYLEPDQPFFLTYGDGVSNVDLNALLAFHKDAGTDATVTAVYPPGRFGSLDIRDKKVHHFQEKPKGDGAFINGGFFVLTPPVLDLIESDRTIFEHKPLQRLAETGQLSAYKHTDFWRPMDTLRDRHYLEELWASPNPPWKIW